jgi:hypothetical protein
MQRKKSRLALMGVMALAISLTVGLASGSLADAKKKKGGGGRSFTVSSNAATPVAAAPSPTGVTVAKIPIGTVGGKATKGKVIGLNGVNATTSFSGSPGFANDVESELIGPGGRTSNLINPVPNNFGPGNSTETSSGPLTETPNSAAGVCVPSQSPPPPPCADPDDIVGPPFAGTVGNQGLLNFSGSGPRGTWILKVFNFGPAPIVVGATTVTGGLILKPLS